MNMTNNQIRCGWLNEDPIYIYYHDLEWGRPEYDTIRLFELICLEGQQAGLSWITILKKRDSYRKLFCNFDPHEIIKLNLNYIESLQNNPEIVRHKGKIQSIINNAQCFIKMKNNGEDFSTLVWSSVNNKTIVNNWKNEREVPTQTKESIALSKALKKLGFTYVGPTICYAFMQASGLVNDHVIDCFCRKSLIS
ncbi:DNA-3-methyladenine glycosylase-like [Danaus plexippus]|uniref:DNA-3-methyladenine glycosylase-like n=1 Tax=Danaus plexippus TaxID=13037 RepID=UPI002AB28DAA|nr:DNA-3-methyladenine glycosylase-like [Danaus plexippus]